jgi:hypothetical protein
LPFSSPLLITHDSELTQHGLLAIGHAKIEAWILQQAGMTFDAKAAPSALRVVKAR